MGSNKATRSRLGSLRQQPNGRWLARVTCGTKANGSRRVVSKAFDSKQDAEAWLLAKKVELSSRADVGSGITLADVWDVYKQGRLHQLAKSTQVGYVYQMEHRVLPALGTCEVASITHGDVQRMLNTMKPSVARQAKATTSAVLTYAVDSNLLSENVMYRARFTMAERSRFADANSDVWDSDPFAAIEDARNVWDIRTALMCMDRIRGLALEPVWLACMGGGLRVEEAFALRAMDVRRIVGGSDKRGDEIWVTQVAVHHATTREESRKVTKTVGGVGIVPLLEPFGKRLWEIVCELPAKDSSICRLSASRHNKAWRNYFAEPTESLSKHADTASMTRGALHGLPYIPLSRMRASRVTIVQEAGVQDSLNRSMHRNSSVVLQRHYMRPDTTEAAIRVSKMIQ